MHAESNDGGLIGLLLYRGGFLASPVGVRNGCAASSALFVSKTRLRASDVALSNFFRSFDDDGTNDGHEALV
jgi:hypothetical protein